MQSETSPNYTFSIHQNMFPPNSLTIQIVVKNSFNRRHSATATACKSMKHHLRLKFYNFFLKWEHHLLTKKPGRFFFSRAQISIFIIRRLQYIRWRRHFLLLSSIPYWPSIIRPNGLFFRTASKLLVFRRRFWWRATPTVSESLQRSLYGQWRKYTTWNGTSNCWKAFIIVKIWFSFALFCERIY